MYLTNMDVHALVPVATFHLFIIKWWIGISLGDDIFPTSYTRWFCQRVTYSMLRADEHQNVWKETGLEKSGLFTFMNHVKLKAWKMVTNHYYNADIILMSGNSFLRIFLSVKAILLRFLNIHYVNGNISKEVN